MSYGSTYIYGQEKTYWTLLNDDCNSCNTISVNECNNWSVGDRLVVVTTGNGATSFGELIQSSDNFKSEERIISDIDLSQCLITLDSALLYYHRGKWIDDKVPTQSEVLNMERSILITGPEPHIYDNTELRNGFQGITTRQSGKNGIMQIHNTRIEKCGRVELGEYCLHFHLIGDCSDCQFIGNVVTKGNNKGITIHGTHNSLVDNNIIYDNRGAFIYIEDGNEYENIISNNILVCPELNNYAYLGAISPGTKCMLYGVKNQEDSDEHEQTGIYINGPSNHIIGNHVIGMENALFINAVFNWGNPDGYAVNRVCKLSMPMGITKGNVFHNNAGFGWYANSLYSTKVITDENGYVADWSSCNLYNTDNNNGNDQSYNFFVEDHVEYFEDFSMGVYECGDITFKNVISAFNNKGLYWKSYRRGINSAPFCMNCTFYNNDIQIMGPGGSGLVEFKDSYFIKTNSNNNQVNINHHCGLIGAHGVTGGLCAAHFLFNNVDFGDNLPNFYTETDDTINSLSSTDALIMYNGYIYYNTLQAHITFDTNLLGCSIENEWTKCSSSLGLRIVKIYSPNRGDLTVIVNGIGYTIPYRNLQRYMGYNTYDTSTCVSSINGIYGPQDYTTDNCKHRVWPSGYTFIVQNGASITINIPNYSGVMYDTFVMEYSDFHLEQTSITMTVEGDSSLSGGPCTISSTHSRTYITQYGPYIPQAGAWWICKGGQPGTGSAWTTTSGINQFNEQIVARLWMVSGSSDVSVKAINGLSSTSTTSTTTKTPTITTTTTKSSTSCGYIPDTCSVDLVWAVNTGSKSNPEYYPNFYQVTNVELSETTQDDMIYYWVCSGINPNGNCDNLQLPCSKTSCDGDTTTPNPTPSPTDNIECGYIPNECIDDIDWAISTGSKGHPDWYPNFYAITKVELDSATNEDMIYYWVCTQTNPNNHCGGLQIPCSRSKCDNGLSFVDITESEDTSTDTETTTTSIILAIVSIASVIIICGIIIFVYCCYKKRNNGKATFKDEEQDKEPEIEVSVEMEVEERETHSTEINEEI